MTRALGIGCMRLSTEAERPDAATARAIVDAAIDAGITLVDTADAYCLSDDERGHNERLLAQLPAGVRVVTKGGLVRPDGAWVPDGRAKHLAAAARASRERLGRIDVYLLHAIDPGVPLATSARSLRALVEDGVVGAVGLSNVNLTQLEAALAIAPIAAVEIELGPYKLDALRGGLVDACTARGIEVLAHRPLGGPRGVARISRDPIVVAHAARLACSPAELVLGWLRSLSPLVIPLPGVTRLATARSAARAVELDAGAKRALDAHFVTVAAPLPAAARVTGGADPADGEVVLVMGIPGAGKSTRAQALAGEGYLRLNRDERGGSLVELARVLDAELEGGARRVVLDNTYASRASRRPVLEVAGRHGLPVRCVVIDTPIERAQRNAIARMLDRHGRLLEPAELRGTDIGPGAQFRWRREYEPPREDEGFAAIEVVPFAGAAVASGTPALLVELDDAVWRGRPRSPAKLALRDGAREALVAWRAAGYAVAATSWQPGVAPAAFAELVAELVRLVGVPLFARACFHAAGPPVCWCRKPLPGLALALAREHHLRLALCAGTGAADRGFAARAGVPYHDVASGWPRPGTMDA